MLPAIASLHLRHELVRRSGATLGTITGTATVILGAVATAEPGILAVALMVAGMWWWTIGKIWAETGTFPRTFGLITMALAVACFALLAAFATTPTLSVPDLVIRPALAAWLFALAAFLWRDGYSSRGE